MRGADPARIGTPNPVPPHYSTHEKEAQTMPLTDAGRLKAVVLAIAIFGVALVGLASAASAASPSLPDPSATGSITIHKIKAPDTPTGLPHDGTAVGTSGLTPVPGVTFTVQQVTGINLTSNQGWQDAAALSTSFNPDDAAGSVAAAGYGLQAAAGSPVTTDATGTASVQALPLGLYLVSETSWPAGATPSAPFLVSIPLTDPRGSSSWLYDVNVYPKNSVDGVSKSVDDSAATRLGDVVSWRIAADIPNVAVIDGYQVVDKLDPKLAVQDARVSLSDGTTITRGSDYTVVFDPATKLLSIVFTGPGRAVLAAHPTAQVVVVVDTVVNAVGEIANSALLYPNAHSVDVRPGEPGGPVESNPVETKWGSITLEKTDQSGRPLTGAVFSVYRSKADAEAGVHAITLGGTSRFGVNAQGQVTIAGLRYSDFANGVAIAPGDAGYQSYWLTEVEAPSGYGLLPAPVEFTVTASTTVPGVDLRVADFALVSPPDCHCHGFLPSTGGPARILAVGGVVLLLAGLLLVAASRRRRHPA